MRNNLLPLLAVLVILGLVVLAPRPEEGGPIEDLPGAASAGPDVASALLELRPLELGEPPGWALQRGSRDPVKRSLDRLIWGPHPAQLASRDLLAAHEGKLAPLVLGRLTALGETDPILVAKLIPALGRPGERTPEVLEELNRRALSTNGLVAKSALRVLRDIASSQALGAALARRHDDDESIRSLARAVLCEACRRGSSEARAYILEDLREHPGTPDTIYLSALGESPWDAETVELLRSLRDHVDVSDGFVVLGALLSLGDEAAAAELHDLVKSADPGTRTNALLMAAQSRRVLAPDIWEGTVRQRQRNEVLVLMSMMGRAIRDGTAEAPLAFELLQAMAYDASHPVQLEALDMLFAFGDAWAVERTRSELLDESGLYLQQTAERILQGAGPLRSEMLNVALGRLKQQNDGVDRYVLLTLVAQLDPENAADPVIRMLMSEQLASRGAMLPALVSLGEFGLARLEQELESDRGAGLYLLAAAHVRSPAALPVLEELATREGFDMALRRQAMDGIVRLAGGGRGEALRRVANAVDDPEVSKRAKLLFWNYL